MTFDHTKSLSRRQLLQASALGIAGLAAGCATGTSDRAAAPASTLPAWGGAAPDFSRALLPVDTRTALLQDPGWYVWGGSPIAGADGTHYLFYSRWRHGMAGRDAATEGTLFAGFDGWMKYSEIAVASAPGPFGPYRHVRTVLASTGDPDRWDCFNATNPHVRQFGGKAYLYFVATHPHNAPAPWRARQHTPWLRYHAGQRIGVVVADSLAELVAGKGRRSARPIAAPDHVDTFQMAVNPSVVAMPDGRFLMMYKTWNAAGGYTNMVGTADTPEGPFPFRSLALHEALQAEDPYLWYDAAHQRYFAIVKDYYPGADRAQALTPQFGALGLVESRDGLHWARAAHPVVSLRQLRTHTGGVLPLERLERPQLLLDPHGTPQVLHAAMSRGAPEAGTQNVAIPLDFSVGARL